MTNQEVYNYIFNYINQFAFPFSQWYVGIATDANDCLFNRHKVNKNGHWVFAKALTDKDAREIEKFLIDNHSTDGGCGGGDENTKFVYAYLITSETSEI